MRDLPELDRATAVAETSRQTWSSEAPALVVAGVSAEEYRYQYFKRIIDLSVATLILLVFAPVFALIALAVWLDSPGPVLFRQERMGYDWRTRQFRPFVMFKYRSMTDGADPAIHEAYVRSLIQNNTQPDGKNSTLKMQSDPRITRVGRVLRKTSLDELPQLLNVLRGEMSLVGPRPPLMYEVAQYQPWQMRRLEALPGMTGWWQINGRNQVSFEEAVDMDIYYIDHRSIGMDLKILLLTPLAVLTGRGAG